jgi:hypothetical protein
MASLNRHERETYRESTPFADDVWVEFAHAELPAGFVVERVTTHYARCARCRRYRISGFFDETWRDQVAEHQANCEGES